MGVSSQVSLETSTSSYHVSEFFRRASEKISLRVVNSWVSL
jgi:hypothetical protein